MWLCTYQNANIIMYDYKSGQITNTLYVITNLVELLIHYTEYYIL